MSRKRNKELLKTISTTEMSSGIMPRGLFDEFYMEVQKESVILDQVRTVTLGREKMGIPKLGVGERNRVFQEEGVEPPETASVDTSAIDLECVKGAVYWSLTQEAVEDASDDEIADKVMDRMVNQFGVDTEELGFIGHSEDVTDEVLGEGDGSTTEFDLFLNHAPIEPGTLEIDSANGGDITVTDDGDGDLTGDASGTIDYETGHIDIDFNDAPDDGELIEADYEPIEFSKQNDGWTSIAYEEDSPTVDAENGPMDVEVMNDAINSLDSKYLRNDPALMVNKRQWQNFLWDTVDEREGLGDAVIRGTADINPFGYDIITSSVIPVQKAYFTMPENLIYGLHRDVTVSAMHQSDEIHDKDLYGKFKITVRDDFAIEEPKALVLIENLEVG